MPVGEVALPPDFVLQELLALVPQTVDDVIAITEAWGLAAGRGDQAFAYLAGEPPANVLAELEQWDERARRSVVHPGAVEAHLRALRALSRHLLAYLESAGDEAIVAAWSNEGMAVPPNVLTAWFWWEGYLNLGLSAFAVHVRVVEGSAAVLTRPEPNLYNACCLQLARYLTRDFEVSRCANERCGKPFTRQRGGSQYGQHRSRGVRYCTPLCAKAQHERDRRRRRASEAAGASGGDVTAIASEHQAEARNEGRSATGRGDDRG